MIFEKFESPAFFLSKDAVLAAFAAGRATGLVVDIGSGLTRVSPVHDGYILKKGITKNNLAGDAITKWMHRCLTANGTVIKPHSAIHKKDSREGGLTVTDSDVSQQTQSYKD